MGRGAGYFHICGDRIDRIDENHAGPLAGFEPTVQPTALASKFW